MGGAYLLVVDHATQGCTLQTSAQSQLQLGSFNHQDVACVGGNYHSVACRQVACTKLYMTHSLGRQSMCALRIVSCWLPSHLTPIKAGRTRKVMGKHALIFV